ncbi:MAG: hypothetical protein J7599_17615 [Niabella sp.]|nr:hypothetical protein [Niabella sp.]
MNPNKNKLCTLAAILLLTKVTTAQTTGSKTNAALWDGMAVAGYVDKGAFINFGGPAVKWTHKPFCISLGMLPSLRVKEDKASASRNATVTPSLGCGLSASYKHLALQVPLYYNAKTATADGKWNVGLGLGYKF